MQTSLKKGTILQDSLNVLLDKGDNGLTCGELADYLTINQNRLFSNNEASARLSALVKRGVAVKTDRIRIYKYTGHQQAVYVATFYKEETGRVIDIDRKKGLPSGQHKQAAMHLKEAGPAGLTCEDTFTLMGPDWPGMTKDGASAALSNTVRKGLAFKSGTKRKSRDGRLLTVYIHKSYKEKSSEGQTSILAEGGPTPAAEESTPDKPKLSNWLRKFRIRELSLLREPNVFVIEYKLLWHLSWKSWDIPHYPSREAAIKSLREDLYPDLV